MLERPGSTVGRRIAGDPGIDNLGGNAPLLQRSGELGGEALLGGKAEPGRERISQRDDLDRGLGGAERPHVDQTCGQNRRSPSDRE